MRIINTALFIALPLAMMACNPHSDAPPPQLAPAPEQQAQEAPKPNEMHKHVEHSEMDAHAPFVLRLETPDASSVKAPSEITVKAIIDTPRALSAPVHINLVLPQGATLIGQDKAEERLAHLPGGLTTRTYKVAITEPLTVERPIAVQVNMRAPNGKYGAYAERTFPKKPEMKIKPPSVPAPPVLRPGGALRAQPGATVPGVTPHDVVSQ